MIESGGGSCAVMLDAAQVDVRLELSEEALPWENALIYTTFVDGQVWAPKASSPADVPLGSSWQGRGVDRLYAACEPPPAGSEPSAALAEGRHDVVIERRCRAK